MMPGKQKTHRATPTGYVRINRFKNNFIVDKGSEITIDKQQPVDILKAAYTFIEEGFEVLPMNGKQPDVQKVTRIRANPINKHNADYWWPDTDKIAIFTGGKKRIECIDFEPVFVQSGNYQLLHDFVKYTFPELYAKLTIESTANRGYHWYYTCIKIGGKQELAARAPGEAEMKQGDKKMLLIESIGQDHWVNVYPSKGYGQEKGDLLLVQEIEPDERDLLIGLCRDYNEIQERNTYGLPKVDYTNPQSVWNVFNEKHGLQWTIDTLQEIGFEILQDNSERIYVRRPGMTTAKQSGSIHKESNVLFLFTTSTIFPAEKPLRPFDIILHLKYDGSFIECCRALEAEGYGKLNVELNFEVSFFDIKRAKKGLSYTVNRTRFMNLLYGHGVGLYRPDGKTYVFIRVAGHYFEEVTIEDIKKVCQQHLDELQEVYDCEATKGELKEFFYRCVDSLFSKNLLEFLPRFIPDMLKDTREECYLPFRNGVVKITAAGGELLSYDQIGKHVWKNAIIDHDITINDEVVYSEWSRFYACVCGADGPDKLTKEQANNYMYLCSLTGYLIHKYKDPARGYAVIFSEAVETEEMGGGTGKGLFCKGIEKIASTCSIAGKSFDPVAKFAWQRVQLHNTVAVIDDVQKGFQFTGLYNVITDGLTIERKNQQEIFISYEDSPKIVVISNYVISSAGNHAERRQKVFEFAPFFSPSYTPEKHFKHLLLKDWDNHEWNWFYNFMISCTADYLKNGIPEMNRSDLLKRRAVSQKYQEDFTSWYFDQYTKNGCAKPKAFSELYTEFLTYAEASEKDFSKIKFTSGIKYASSTAGHKLSTERDRKDGNKLKVMVEVLNRDAI
jgi:hypothetical protein